MRQVLEWMSGGRKKKKNEGEKRDQRVRQGGGREKI